MRDGESKEEGKEGTREGKKKENKSQKKGRTMKKRNKVADLVLGVSWLLERVIKVDR